MILAIDIGNTQTVLGIYRRNILRGEWRISSARRYTEDEIWLHVKFFCEHNHLVPESIQGIAIASVIPHLTQTCTRMTEKYLKQIPVVISGVMDVGLTIGYAEPATLGADRICSAVAAFAKYGGPVIVVDFGTATTINAISKKGEFLGGTIAPGVGLAVEELHRRTAQLPAVPIAFPATIIGTTTTTNIQSGIMFGALEAAEGIIRRMKRIVGKHAIVVATGGYARIMAEMSDQIRYVEPSLVLDGARIIFERSHQRRPRQSNGKSKG